MRKIQFQLVTILLLLFLLLRCNSNDIPSFNVTGQLPIGEQPSLYSCKLLIDGNLSSNSYILKTGEFQFSVREEDSPTQNPSIHFTIRRESDGCIRFEKDFEFNLVDENLGVIQFENCPSVSENNKPLSEKN